MTFSMLEIYNEQVRDLLSKESPKGGLQVRQNAAQGLFYVECLKKVPVGCYKDIEKRMEQGWEECVISLLTMIVCLANGNEVFVTLKQSIYLP